MEKESIDGIVEREHSPAANTEYLDDKTSKERRYTGPITGCLERLRNSQRAREYVAKGGVLLFPFIAFGVCPPAGIYLGYLLIKNRKELKKTIEEDIYGRNN
ncbi:hypothetical protein JW711_00545 [Candidatus Woesearchaeota archaeon]|nr:hypothetical protein [Candidatus Woesearchaeota archaeon]